MSAHSRSLGLLPHPSLPVCLLLSPEASHCTPHSLGEALPPADASTLQPSLPPAPLPPPSFPNKHMHFHYVHIFEFPHLASHLPTLLR